MRVIWAEDGDGDKQSVRKKVDWFLLGRCESD